MGRALYRMETAIRPSGAMDLALLVLVAGEETVLKNALAQYAGRATDRLRFC
jgi:hypothetical protein